MNMFLAEFGTNVAWLEKLLNAVIKVINPILIIAAIAGMVYAIVVGIKFVKADSKDEREEAKNKLIYVIVGIVVTCILIALFYFLAFNLFKNLNIASYFGFKNNQ